MTAKRFKMVVLAIGVVAAVGMAASAFAGKGYGRGYGNSEGNERGWNCPGYGARAELNDEEAARLDTEREAFLDATSDLRRDIRQKNLELQSELNKKDIDGAKASGIQKEISDLQAQLDQKRLDHQMKVRDIDPDLGTGPGRWAGRGPGRRGACW